MVLLGVVLVISIALLVFAVQEKQTKEALVSQQKPSSAMASLVEKPKVTLPSVLYNLNGVIKRIEQGAIVLEANVPAVNQAGEPISQKEIKKALLTPETKFTRLHIEKDEQNGQQSIKQATIALGDLKLGDKIEVIANRDIKDALEFEAKQVRVLP